MLCTLVCFAALKFKCISFYFCPVFLFSPLICCALLLSSHLPRFLILSLYVSCILLILLPFPLDFPLILSANLSPLFHWQLICLCVLFSIFSLFTYWLSLLLLPHRSSPALLSPLFLSSFPLLVAHTFYYPHHSSVKIFLVRSLALKYGSWMAIPPLFSLRHH